MKEKALLTVIIPVYNTEKTVGRTVRSVMAQTWGNIEIIIVNDGSPDNASKVCMALAAEDSRITVINKENAGLGMARNTGLEHAHGRFVAFLDSDDWISPTAYESCIERIQEAEAGACYYGRKVYGSDGSYSVVDNVPDKLIYVGDEVVREFAPKYFGEWKIKYGDMYIRESSCCALYDRDLIERYNIRFMSERDCLSEDVFFNLDICRYAKAVCIIPKNLYNQGYNPNSLTKKRDMLRIKKIWGLRCCLRGYAERFPEITDVHSRIDYRVISYVRAYIRDEAKAVGISELYLSIKNIMENDELMGSFNEFSIFDIDKKTKKYIHWMKNRKAMNLAILYKTKGFLAK